MNRWLLLGALALISLLSAPAAAHADIDLPDGFATVTLASGLWDPTAFAYAPDGRIFVAEKARRVRVVRPRLARRRARCSTSAATSPSPATAGCSASQSTSRTSRPTAGCTCSTPTTPTRRNSEAEKTARLTRITVNPTTRSRSPETVLLGRHRAAPCPPPTNTVDCIPSTSNSHSIGTVRAAPDGTLWVGSGDGADYNAMDPAALRTFDEHSLSGKILHVDRNGHGLPGHAFCPGETDLDEGLHQGVRQGIPQPVPLPAPDRRPPVVGDVGWSSREEIDLVRAGRSYGWPCWEGPEDTPTTASSTSARPSTRRSHPPARDLLPHNQPAAPSWPGRSTRARAIPLGTGGRGSTATTPRAGSRLYDVVDGE